eukprot:gene4018-8000_t
MLPSLDPITAIFAYEPTNHLSSFKYLCEIVKTSPGTCCTVFKGDKNGGCLLHYAHVLYDFVIPFDWEIHHGTQFQQCDQIYIPSFPIVEQWIRSLYPQLPINTYAARGSCWGKHNKMKREIITLTSIDLIRSDSRSNIMKEFRAHTLTTFHDLNCTIQPFTLPGLEIVVIDRTGMQHRNFTAKCRHYNRNIKKWFGANMPINCGCDGGDIRGNLKSPNKIIDIIKQSLLPTATLSSNVHVKRLDGLSARDTVDAFCRASIVIGHHGAGLLNAVFSPPKSLLIEVPREPGGSHMEMMPLQCNTTDKLHIRLDNSLDFDQLQEMSYKHPYVNMTHVISQRLSQYTWFKRYFKHVGSSSSSGGGHML